MVIIIKIIYREIELTSQEYFKQVDIRQRRKEETSVASGYVVGGLTASGSRELKENAKLHAIGGVKYCMRFLARRDCRNQVTGKNVFTKINFLQFLPRIL